MSLTRRTPLRSATPLKRGKALQAKTGLQRRRPPQQKAAPKDTGFSQAVKLAVRTRAGNGDPDQARCEPCGHWLGRSGGQVHHRQNRQMGGSRERNGLPNAALLCGTPFVYCHGEATAGSTAMKDAGWVVASAKDPASVPVGLWDGRRVLLAADGTYAPVPGEVSAA